MRKIISTTLIVCVFVCTVSWLSLSTNVEAKSKTTLTNKYKLVNVSKKTVKKKYLEKIRSEMYYFPLEPMTWNYKKNDIDFAMGTILHPRYEDGFYSFFKKKLWGEFKNLNYKDPKKQFSVAHVLNADKVDWLIKNVLNTKPDRTVHTDRYYYHKNKVYISSDGGGSLDEFKLAKLKKVKKARYKFVFKVDFAGDGRYAEKVIVVAELRKSPVIGIYWSYYSYSRKSMD